MAGKSDKNTHLEHLEDDIINLGYKGAQQSIAFVEALLDLFSGKAGQSVDITVKWDGAPAIVAGKDPETGMFFVATKHGAFAKVPKLCFSEEMVDLYHQGGLADTMKTTFRELKDLGMKDVLQGDVMFTPKIKKHTVIDGTSHVTFKPNTIMYAVPKSDPLYTVIENANLGIVFHTKYSGRGPVNNLSASFGVDVSKLKKSTTAWVRDAKYQDMSGKLTLTAQETRTVSSKLALAKTNTTVAKKFLNELATQDKDLTVGYLFKIFVNRLVREGKPITQRNLAGLNTFIVQRIQDKEKGMKTAAGAAKYQGIRKDLEAYLRKNAASLRAMFTIYESLATIKNILVNKLNTVQGISTFIETEQGFKATDPEGYVAIDRAGNAVKLVNRMEFSQANFNAVKDWGGPPAPPEEPNQELKTMVFAFGRLNPPTIGHEKLINKILSEARIHKADHLMVLSRTQKAPKDPLDGDTKLMYAQKMFPNANITVATKEMPTFFGWLKKFYESGYEKVIMIAGSDRVGEYTRLINQYNGKPEQYTFKSVDVISAGERDPDADGASGMSASKLREFAAKNDFSNFRKGIPRSLKDADTRNLMAAVQAGM
jgi:hypothetical protein